MFHDTGSINSVDDLHGEGVEGKDSEVTLQETQIQNDERGPLIPNPIVKISTAGSDEGSCIQCVRSPHFRTIVFLSIYMFFSTASGGLSASVLTIAKRNYFGSDSAAASVQAYFDSVSAVISMMLLPVFGTLSDSYGRFPFVFLLGVLTIVPSAFLVVFPSDMMLLNITTSIAFLLTGNKGGSPAIQTVVADISTEKDRALYYAGLMACAGFGLVVSPLGEVLSLSNEDIYFIALILAIIGGVPLMFVKETLPKASRVEFALSNVDTPFKNFRTLRGDHHLRFLSIIAFCSGLPEAGLMETITFYLNDRLAFTPLQNGIFIAEVGILVLLTSTIFMKIMLQYITERQLVLFGLSMNCLHLLAYSMAFNSYFVFFFAVPCAALSFVTFPCIASMAVRNRAVEDRGKIMGVLGAVKGLTMVFGPLAFGVLYSQCKGPPINLPEVPMLGGAAIVLGVLVVAYYK
eukprot:PhF_6_TR6923/c0_g1_i2/m.10105